MNAITIRDAEKAFIDEQIKAGNYESTDAVVSAAFALLRKHEQKKAELRALLQEGLDDIAAGRIHEYTSTDDLLADIKQLTAAKRRKTGTDH